MTRLPDVVVGSGPQGRERVLDGRFSNRPVEVKRFQTLCAAKTQLPLHKISTRKANIFRPKTFRQIPCRQQNQPVQRCMMRPDGNGGFIEQCF